MNPFSMAKHLGTAAIHLGSGNLPGAALSATKVGIASIPVVGHIPGATKTADLLFKGEASPLTLREEQGLHDMFDADGDGDIDFSDLSHLIEQIADMY
jgi:hypothetical protein